MNNTADNPGGKLPKGLKILLVEDMASDAELIGLELRREKISSVLRRVETKDDFLNKLREFNPDLILADYALPQFDGMTALSLARERTPGTPTIIVTGSINEETAVDCIKAGAADYVLKDHISRLGPAVRGAIEKGRVTEEKERAETELRQNYDIQGVLNSLLSLSLEDVPIEEILDRTLGLILAIPWLSFESRGAVFLVEDDPNTLVMKSSQSLAKEIEMGCAHVPFTKCICGLAAASRKPQFTNCLDERHTITYKGIQPHGHYAIPIQTTDSVLGVINLYLKEGHKYSKREEGFLTAVADTLAGIIQRKRGEASIERLNRELSEKNRELEQIIYVTSHDLRTPLVNIDGFSKELNMSIDELLTILKDGDDIKEVTEKLIPIIDEDIPEATKYISRSISKMDSLLAGLLKLSRLGRDELNIGEIDMNRLISDVSSNFQYKMKDIGAQFVISKLPGCSADEMQLNQVFSNLIDNAIKSFDPKRPGIIKISGSRDGSEAVYYVEDNGGGIEPQDREVIFNIFHRLHNMGSDGEGLGLTIVQKIIERHKGKVWLDSEPGKGSRFYVSLPSTVQ